MGGPRVIEEYYHFLISLLHSSLSPSPAAAAAITTTTHTLTVQSFPVLVLTSLLSRLLRMLSTSVQCQLLSPSDVCHDSWLWNCITSSVLHSDTLEAMSPHLVTTAIHSLTNDTSSSSSSSSSSSQLYSIQVRLVSLLYIM